MPINNHAAIVSTLFGEQERLCRKVEAVSLIVLLGEEYRIGSRSASQVKHPRARRLIPLCQVRLYVVDAPV